jgi:hypothetical protein
MFHQVYFTEGDFEQPSDILRAVLQRSSSVMLLSSTSVAEHEGRMVDTPVIMAMRNIQYLQVSDFPDV